MLRDWNNAVKHGCTNQATFNRIIANADDNTKMYFAGLNKGKGSLEGLKAAQNATKTSTVGLTIAQTALNMAISMGLMAAISLAIKGFDKMINHAKRASEAADEAFEETSSKVQEQQEELKTLDELISKYRELKKDGNLDIEGRKEVKELQSDIADLVGTQARNLDLVNGKLDDEIEKLDEISAKEAKRAYETATANYNNSQRANKKAAGDDSYMFSDGYAYTGSREKDAEKILKEYGFGDNVRSGGFFGSTLFITDSFDNNTNVLEGAQEKADYLQSMIDVLEQNGQRATELYSGLISQRDKYLGYIDSQQGAADILVNSWITYSQYSNEELSNISIDSVKSFEAYRQKMIEAAKNDESVGKLLSDGTLSEKDLETAVNDFMATSTKFSDWYKQWIDGVQDTGKDADEMTVSMSELKTASEAVSVLSSAFKELSDEGYISLKSLSKIQEATGLSGDTWEEYQTKLLNAKIGSEEFNQTMADLTYQTLENKLGLDKLANADEAYVSRLLEENNVLNANEVAHEAVERAKAQQLIQSKLAEGVTKENITALLDEADSCDITADAFIYLVAQEIIFNSTNLTVEQQIEALQKLAKQAGLTGAALSGVLNTPYGKSAEEQQKWAKENGFTVEAKKDKNGNTVHLKNGKQDWIWTDEAGNTYENANEAALSIAGKAFADALNDENSIVPEYSEKSKKATEEDQLEKARDYAEKVADIQEDLAEKEADFAENMAEAWKEEHLEQLKDGLEKQKDIIDRYKKNVEVLDFGLEYVETDDFGNRADLLSEKLDKLKSYGVAMREEFDRVANTIPQTGDEAVELANRLEELGSDMRSNVTAIRETVVAMQMLATDMASTLINDRMGELQSQFDNLDKIINILNSDYKNDYRHASNVLSLDILLPVNSEYDKKRREKQKSDKALIKTEQETQDKINEIVTKSLEMQAKQNAEAREKERQELIKDMEKARKDAEKKLAEAHQDYMDFLEENELATDDSIQNIEDSFANMELEFPEPDTSAVESAIERIKEKLREAFKTFNMNITADTGVGGVVVPGYTSITSPYGDTEDRTAPHEGIDYGAPLGSPIYAYDKGTVTLSAWNGGYGNCVIIDHGDGDVTLYGHASRLNVSPGEEVARGQKIAEVGSTGWSTGPHLHFTYLKNGVYTDPAYIFSPKAAGTPGGNRLAKRLGIAGENYRPEILVDKATGEKTYIDSPTVIDLSKTDVIGEKATARIPKFATGTPTTNEKYLKELKEVCDVFDVPYEIALALIDVESGGGTAYDTWTANYANAVGITQITPSALGDFYQTWHPVSADVVAKLEENNVDISNSRTQDESAYRDNIWTGIANLRLIQDRYGGAYGWDTSSWDNALGWYYAGGGYDGTDGTNYAATVMNYANSASFQEAAKALARIELTVSKISENANDGTVKKSFADILKGINDTVDTKTDTVKKSFVDALNDTKSDVPLTLEDAFKADPDNIKLPTAKDVAAAVRSEVKQDPPPPKKDPFSIETIESFYNDGLNQISFIEKDIIAELQSIENDDTLDDFTKSQKIYGLIYEKAGEASSIGESVYNGLKELYNEWLAEVAKDPTKWSIDVYNAYKDAFADITDITYGMADRAVETKQQAAEARFQNSVNWIEERNFYNDWDVWGDNEVAAWERVLKRFKSEFPNELGKIKEIEQEIFEARKKAFEKSISDIEDYISARNTYKDWDAYGDSEVKAIQRITKVIEYEYSQRLISYDEYIDKLQEQTQRIYSLAQNEIDESLGSIDRYISARNHYNDWDEVGDSEIKAIRRQIRYLRNAYDLNLMSYEEYTEKYAEYTQKLYSVAKDSIIEEVSKLMEDYEEMKNLESSQLESNKTLLQSYYDVTNAVVDAQQEINKELKASMTMYEYLNEDTRELLFNQEDFNILNEELLEIQSAADELRTQYQDDILNANAETIAEITSQYQMQYETMMKQYEIAKAELEVAKKRQKLDNVLAERNTRMFINGQWQWVAKTQDIIDAQNELAEAEAQRKKQEAALEQTEAINDFTAQINSLETDLNEVKKYWADMQELLNGESDEVAEALKQISEVSSPELQRVIEATGGNVDSFSAVLSESTTTLSTVINGDRGLTALSGNVSDLITDLQGYSDAIQLLTAQINGAKVNTITTGDSGGNSTQDIISQMKANSAAWKTATTQEEKDRLHEANVSLGKQIGLSEDDYNSETGVWNYPGTNSSSSSSGSSKTWTDSAYASSLKTSSSSSASSSSKQVNTSDQYVNSGGTIQSNPNWDGKKKGSVGSFYKHADGTRFTPGGLTALGEEGFEAFIDGNGRLIPINQPTIGNIGAGGIVFNREQMANLRNLWDLSNLSRISPYISSSNANNQSTVIDNSIHINGLTVGERGNEDWINGLRRYVATHK